jgi:ABC-type sugar transport system permease subunit
MQAIWAVTPFAMITFFAGLQTLPGDRVEAASIDGAGYWRKFWHVTLPHLRILLLFVALISIMDAYRIYDSVFVFAGDRFTDAHTLQVYNVRVAIDPQIGRVGKGNAIGLLNVLGIFVVLIPFLWASYKDQIAERT